MDLENVELTIEEILNIHRLWITTLYVESGKTEEQILAMLYERGFSVRISQLHACLSQWNLMPSSPSFPPQPGLYPSTTPRTFAMPIILPHLPEEESFSIGESEQRYELYSRQESIRRYSQRPLPPLPRTASPTSSMPSPIKPKNPRSRPQSRDQRINHSSSNINIRNTYSHFQFPAPQDDQDLNPVDIIPDLEQDEGGHLLIDDLEVDEEDPSLHDGESQLARDEVLGIVTGWQASDGYKRADDLQPNQTRMQARVGRRRRVGPVEMKEKRMRKRGRDGKSGRDAEKEQGGGWEEWERCGERRGRGRRRYGGLMREV